LGSITIRRQCSTVTATYNNAGRLTTLTNGSSTETALYNALGQRIEIEGGVNGTVLYAYDEAGHLLGEYDGTGALIEETVWLGGAPSPPCGRRAAQSRSITSTVMG
jgi:YD repeat-containing protein